MNLQGCDRTRVEAGRYQRLMAELLTHTEHVPGLTLQGSPLEAIADCIEVDPVGWLAPSWWLVTTKQALPLSQQASRVSVLTR